MMQFHALAAPFGAVGFVGGSDGLHHVLLTARTPAETARHLGREYAGAEHNPRLLPAFQRQLSDYLDGKRIRFRIRAVLDGMTEFQRRVLEACAKVGYGESLTYGELARRIGCPLAARAVGAALGRNPVPLVIPCHRVVGSNGSLGGFSAEQGIAVKRWLLNLESSGSPQERRGMLPACGNAK